MHQGSRPADEASARPAILARLARDYIWWEPTGTESFGETRVLAQTMELGTYDDLLLIENLFGRERLAEVMRTAAPGWFSPRSWEFWRGRLVAAGHAIPEKRPQRSFHAAVL